MFTDPANTVVRKRLGFFSIAAISLAAVTISVIFCGSGVALYGMHLLDKKSESIVGLLGDAAARLPEYRKALPPALADAIDDEREPAYSENLKVNVRLASSGGNRDGSCAIVQVENTGSKVVSVLSLRVVAVDSAGDPVWERGTWAATPLQIDNEWRGPLQPHETRLFSIGWCGRKPVEKLTHEITDLRVWRGPPAAETKPEGSPVAKAGTDRGD